jgi:hypothetical protein
MSSKAVKAFITAHFLPASRHACLHAPLEPNPSQTQKKQELMVIILTKPIGAYSFIRKRSWRILETSLQKNKSSSFLVLEVSKIIFFPYA